MTTESLRHAFPAQPALPRFGVQCVRVTLFNMTTSRLEAFSDAVIAILITIMVLELRAPTGAHLSDLWPLRYVFLSYILSFVYLAIYWNNHHHMLYVTEQVSGGVLWANMHLLLWLSLVPFTTAWMGENHFATTPTAVYGVVLLLAAIAYVILQSALIHQQGHDSLLARAIGHDLKGKASPILYVVGIAASLALPWLGFAVYTLVAVVWLVPDRRIERAVEGRQRHARAGQ